MSVKEENEGPWLFRGREVLKGIAARKGGAGRLRKLADRKADLDARRDAASAELDEVTLSLADFIQAACGRSAYMVADSVLSNIAAREDPAGYGRITGKRPPPRAPAEDERRTALYSCLRGGARRLRPVFKRLWQLEERCLEELAGLIPPAEREKYRRWHQLEEMDNGDLWLQILFEELGNWNKEKK